jgi:transposase
MQSAPCAELDRSGEHAHSRQHAEAICEAVGRPNMNFVAAKTEEQQAVLMVHRARSLVMASRTALGNQIRGMLGEFGVVLPQGVSRLRARLPRILEDAENGLPALAREVLVELLKQFRELEENIQQYDLKIRTLAQHSESARRLMQIESIGPMTATAIVAGIGNPQGFKSGRSYAASLGLIPKQNCSGARFGWVPSPSAVAATCALCWYTVRALSASAGEKNR